MMISRECSSLLGTTVQGSARWVQARRRVGRLVYQSVRVRCPNHGESRVGCRAARKHEHEWDVSADDTSRLSVTPFEVSKLSS
jgi:hypothetical protein